MPKHNLLGQLTSERYFIEPFLKDWLSFQAIGNLWTSAGTSNILTPSALFMNRQNSLTQLALEKASISDLKRFLHIRANTQSFSPIYPAKEIKQKILSSLKHPDADLEYRLLALNFLSENPFTFELPHDSDSLTLLLYCTNPSAIDLEAIVKKIQQLLEKTQTYLQGISESENESENEKEQKNDGTIKTIISIVFMLNSIAHKLEKDQARKLILHVYNFCIVVQNYVNWDTMDEAGEMPSTICLLGVLVVKHQVKEIHELAEFLINLDKDRHGFVGKYSFFQVTISEVFSLYPSTFTNAISQGLLSNISDNEARAIIVLKAARNNLLENSQHDIVENLLLIPQSAADLRVHLMAIEAVTGLWNHFDDSQRDIVKNTLLTLLSNTNVNVHEAALEAVTDLWHHFDDSQRDIVKNILLTLLSNTGCIACNAALEAATGLWNHFDNNHRDIVKNTLLIQLSNTDDYIRCQAIKVAARLWNHLDDNQRDIVKNTLLTLLSDTHDDFVRHVARITAARLWNHLDDNQRNNMLPALLKKDNDHKYWLEDIQQVIISNIHTLSETQLLIIIEEMAEFLDDTDLRTKALDIFMLITCHYPNYSYHDHLSAIKNSLLKAYLEHAIEGMRATFANPGELMQSHIAIERKT